MAQNVTRFLRTQSTKLSACYLLALISLGGCDQLGELPSGSGAGAPADPSKPGAKGPCGGDSGLGCETGEFCQLPESAQCGNAADVRGVCTQLPDQCYEIYQPVCGCDGKTYSNDCKADEAGVSILHTGECSSGSDDGSPKTDSCGGDSGLTCETGEFCKLPESAQCGNAADVRGVCTQLPDQCYEIYQPVCGCDGKTYSNDCKADEAGVSVRSQEAC